VFTPVQECTCRSLDTHKSQGLTRPMVLLASEPDLPRVRAMIAASVPLDTECLDGTWRQKDGQIIMARRYADPAPSFPEGFDIYVCNGGHVFSPGERTHIKRWRSAAR